MEKITEGEVEFQFLNPKPLRMKLGPLLTFLFEKLETKFVSNPISLSQIMYMLIFCFRNCFSKLKKENRRPFLFF